MSVAQAVFFLPFALIIGVWVSWTDMSRMRIPNVAVLCLWGVWVVLGLLVLPWQVWAWGIAMSFAVMLVGILGMVLRLFGGGDAKFTAAMAPYFVQDELRNTLFLSIVVILAAYALHRLWRAIPPLRNLAPDWQSWTHTDFPMGLALAGILVFHLALVAAKPVMAAF
jgi:prepilin peptidase CpaA